MLYFGSTGLVGAILAEIMLAWNKLDERMRKMYTLDIIAFGALMILMSYGQTGRCQLLFKMPSLLDAGPVQLTYGAIWEVSSAVSPSHVK